MEFETDLTTFRTELPWHSRIQLDTIQETWGVVVTCFSRHELGEAGQYFLRGQYHDETVVTQGHDMPSAEMFEELVRLILPIKNRLDREQHEADQPK